MAKTTLKRSHEEIKSRKPENTAAEASSSSEDELDMTSSEDELDEKLSGSESDELDGSDEENGDNEENDGNDEPPQKVQKTTREQRKEQKRLLKERKLQRSLGAQIEQIKALWEQLRAKHPPITPAARKKLCDEIWSLSKDHIKDLVLKHDASRVVQTLVKHAPKDVRNEIAVALKGSYFDLARSSYGKYLLIKLLHYGLPESRAIVVQELHGHVRKLMRHKEGAYVTEDLYCLYATAAQKKQMRREFWGARYAVFNDDADKDITSVAADSSARSVIAGNLSQTITAAVGKGLTGFQILHGVMRDYAEIATDSEFNELIELLADQVAELVHTPDGCDVACRLVARATAKQRKAILKGLKAHAKSMVENEHGHAVLVTIFLTVDDTVLVTKTFGFLAQELAEFGAHKYARRPFLYVLCGLDGRYFNPRSVQTFEKYVEMSKNTSKKPQDGRKAELLKKYTPALYDSILEAEKSLFTENMGLQFAGEVILHAASGEEFSSKRLKVLEYVSELFLKDLKEPDHVLSMPFAPRFLKLLIQGGVWKFKTQSLEKDNSEGVGLEFAWSFAQRIQSNLAAWVALENGAFVVGALYEQLKDHGEAKSFIKDVTKFKKILKGDQVGKGGKFLLGLISK